MPYVVGKDWTKAGEPSLVLYHENGRQVVPQQGEKHPRGPSGELAEEIRIWTRPLTGRHMKEIDDESLILKKGRGRLLQGTSAKAKIMFATVAVEGLVRPDGSEIETIDGRSYDQTDVWILNALFEHIKEENGLDKENDETEGE